MDLLDLDYLVKNVIVPTIDSQVPLPLESALVLLNVLKAVHVGSSWAHHLVQFPLSFESLLITNHE